MRILPFSIPGVSDPEWRHRFGAIVSVLGWLLLVALIASRYIGRSSSPYGVCYAESGRSVPCGLVGR